MNLLKLPVQYETATDKSSDSQDSQDKTAMLYDLSKLEKILGGNMEQIEKMILKFLDITPGYIEDMNNSFKENDIDGIERTAHKIKASIDLIANNNLKSNIRLIHDFSRDRSNLDKLPKLVEHFSDSYQILLVQLKKLV